MHQELDNPNPQVTISPEEDARLPIYEADILKQWTKFRPSYLKMLKERGRVQQAVRDTALACIRTLHAYQNAGHGADMGREAAQDLIIGQGEAEK